MKDKKHGSFLRASKLKDNTEDFQSSEVYYSPFPQQDKNGKVVYVPKPFINLAVNYKRGEPRVIKALVDSGADFNLFPGYVGDLLKINVKKGSKRNAVGIGGMQIESFFHEGVGIFIEGHKIETNAYFSYQQQIPILGQNGFFDKCNTVTFNRKEEEIIITI